MVGRPPPPNPVHQTTMRLTTLVMQAASEKAARLGVSRTKYVEALVRKDLGLDAVGIKAQRNSVFG